MSKYEPIYGSLDGVPTVYEDGSGFVAWWYVDGSWKAAPGADVFTKSAVLDKATFDKMFPGLPDPPLTEA